MWIDRDTAVVQFVLGPGKHCRKTTASFFQDIGYLQEAGSYLTTNHGLCNIGQWHSHHRMCLPCPSGGDKSTVWNNMPELKLHRYIVFIATIGHDNTAMINCFLFETTQDDQHYPVLQGKLEILKDQGSPFRSNHILLDVVQKGQEKSSEIQRSMKRKISDHFGQEKPTKDKKITTLDIVPRKMLTVIAGGEGKCFTSGEVIVVEFKPT